MSAEASDRSLGLRPCAPAGGPRPVPQDGPGSPREEHGYGDWGRCQERTSHEAEHRFPTEGEHTAHLEALPPRPRRTVDPETQHRPRPTQGRGRYWSAELCRPLRVVPPRARVRQLRVPVVPDPNSIADKYDMTRSGSLFGTRAAIASRLAWRLLPSRAFPRRGAGGQRSEASGSRVLPSNHAPAGSTRRSADPRTEHSRGRRHPRRPTDRACPATSPAAGYTAPAATASTGRVRPARPRAMGTGHPYWLSSIEPAQSSA